MTAEQTKKDAFRNELLTTYTYEQIYTLAIENGVQNVANKGFEELVDELIEILPYNWINFNMEPGDIA